MFFICSFLNGIPLWQVVHPFIEMTSVHTWKLEIFSIETFWYFLDKKNNSSSVFTSVQEYAKQVKNIIE